MPIPLGNMDSITKDPRIAVFGSTVREAIAQSKYFPKDLDVIATPEFFFSNVREFANIGISSAYANVFLNGHILAQGRAYMKGADALDMVVIDSIDNILSVFENIDIRANAVYLYNGELYEAVPGAIKDCLEKRIVVLNPNMPAKRLKNMNNMIKGGWNLVPADKVDSLD